MGSYLGTIFALPDSLFAGAVPASAAPASALADAALPAVPSTAAAHQPAVVKRAAALLTAADAEPPVTDAADAAKTATDAAAAGHTDGSPQQHQNSIQPVADAGEPGITCRACDVGAPGPMKPPQSNGEHEHAHPAQRLVTQTDVCRRKGSLQHGQRALVTVYEVQQQLCDGDGESPDSKHGSLPVLRLAQFRIAVMQGLAGGPASRLRRSSDSILRPTGTGST